jgi:hypothetical protein
MFFIAVYIQYVSRYILWFVFNIRCIELWLVGVYIVSFIDMLQLLWVMVLPWGQMSFRAGNCNYTIILCYSFYCGQV